MFYALRNPVARDIDLSFCGIGPEAGVECGQCLRRSTVQWTRLNLEGNTLGKDGANPIFWALRMNCTLTELLLSDNGIGGDFGTDRDKRGDKGNSLSGMIEYNYTLRRVDLARNEISRECAQSVARALVENPCLVAFNFERNHLDAAAADHLATRLDGDRQVRYLNLRSNDVSWTGAVRLCVALENNWGLLSLDLGYNEVGSCGPVAGLALASAIEKNVVLRRLDVEGNELGPEAGAALARALTRNDTLQSLNARNNRFDKDVGKAFLEALEVNRGVMEVGFSIIEIGEDWFDGIDALMRKRASVAGLGDKDIPDGGDFVEEVEEEDSDDDDDD